jgi:sulfite reductase beta subunit-like hemoprotein
LPRKYKIAFAACERDCSGATIHDAGFIGRKQNGVEGFAVQGTAISSEMGKLLRLHTLSGNE